MRRVAMIVLLLFAAACKKEADGSYRIENPFASRSAKEKAHDNAAKARSEIDKAAKKVEQGARKLAKKAGQGLEKAGKKLEQESKQH